MYSAHREGRSVIADRFIRTLRSKIYKYIKITFIVKISMKI